MVKNFNEEFRILELEEQIKSLKVSIKLVEEKEELKEKIKELESEKENLIFKLTKSDDICKKEIQSIIKEEYIKDSKELNQSEQYKLLEKIRTIFGRNIPNHNYKRKGLGTWLNFIGYDTNYFSVQDDVWSRLIILE